MPIFKLYWQSFKLLSFELLEQCDINSFILHITIPRVILH